MAEMVAVMSGSFSFLDSRDDSSNTACVIDQKQDSNASGAFWKAGLPELYSAMSKNAA